MNESDVEVAVNVPQYLRGSVLVLCTVVYEGAARNGGAQMSNKRRVYRLARLSDRNGCIP